MAVSFLLIVNVSFPYGPAVAGTSCMPYSWSSDAGTALIAPAGLVRLESVEYQVSGAFDGSGSSRLISAGAAGIPIGDFVLGAGGGWDRTEGTDTLTVRICAARTLKGDPIGFMEGVFGPSISVGASLGYAASGLQGDQMTGALTASAGMQFSIFPTIAVGLDISELRLAGDQIVDRTIGYGVTSIFDRSFRAHLSVTGNRVSLGGELSVGDALTFRTGSDGRSWNSGAKLESGIFSFEWAISLSDDDVRHFTGLTVSPGGST